MRPADLALTLLDQGQVATLRVQGNSMWPMLCAGDEVRIEKRSHYKIGDLVAFDDGRSSLVVHRLVACRGDQVRTRGDYLFQADPWISRAQLVGGVSHISRIGWSKIGSALGLLDNTKRLTLWYRERRRIARSWSFAGVLMYILYRTLLRPFQPSFRCLIAARATAQKVDVPDGYTLREGYLDELRLELASSGLILPANGDERTFGAVLYHGALEVGAAWTTEVEPGVSILHDSYVLDDHRGYGLAKSLTRWVIAHWQPGTSIFGAIQHHNAASRAKNRAAGFREIGYQLELRPWFGLPAKTWHWSRRDEAQWLEAWKRGDLARVRR